jgi:6,7-dimethyl-8-ribityllumazine synthase
MAKTSKTKSAAAKKSQLRILIVEARYYPHIADALLLGATEELTRAGAAYDVVTVPGALEIPGVIAFAADAAAKKRAPYDGAVALGCVIQGETYHFDIVANESAHGLMQLTLGRQLAAGNGILTVDTEAQAVERLGGVHGHKGREAAKAALAVIAVQKSLSGK